MVGFDEVTCPHPTGTFASVDARVPAKLVHALFRVAKVDLHLETLIHANLYELEATLNQIRVNSRFHPVGEGGICQATCMKLIRSRNRNETDAGLVSVSIYTRDAVKDAARHNALFGSDNFKDVL